MKQQINEVVKDYSNKRKQKIVFGVVSVILSCIVCALTVYLFAGSAITESVNPTDDLNLINNSILGNSIDNSVLNNSIDNNILSNAIDNTVSSNLIDNTVLSNSIDTNNILTPSTSTLTALTPETSVSGLTSETSVTSSNSKGALLTSTGPASKTGAKATTIGDSSTAVPSIDALEGITFKLFNYDGTNEETGVNDNGGFQYFTFHNSFIKNPSMVGRPNTDESAFYPKHATVLPNLSADGYPIFDARTGNASDNFSIGYLFGAEKNARGEDTNGVTAYTPTNTLLQKRKENGVDYYYYDSAENAVDYDTVNNKFIVRNYTEKNSVLATYPHAATRAEFFPFTYRTTTTLKKNNSTGIEYNYDTSEVDYWFGMTMDANFFMPEDGLLEGKPMEFSFSGDDDVYVFIDDVLVLDIGGSHWPVDGSINFATGFVEAYFNWDTDGRNDGTNRHYVTTIYDSFVEAGKANTVEWVDTEYYDTKDKVYKTTKTFADYSSHTIKFFYLERGACVSNCKIKFNMPILPPGELNVKKEVTGLTSDIAESYQFKIYDVTKGTATALSNYPFTIAGNSYSTDANGVFTLKKDETAKFQVTINNKYRIDEVNSGENYEPFSCTLNGTACSNIDKTDNILISDTTAQNVVFTNKRITYDITVKKDVIDDATGEFDFTFVLKNNIGNIIMPMYEPSAADGYSLNNTTGEITFNLKDNESIILKGIPRSVTATLKEVTHDGYNVLIKEGVEVLSKGDTCKIPVNKNISITVENIPDVRLPETGSSSELIMLLAGIVLMIVPFVYKYVYLKNRKG